MEKDLELELVCGKGLWLASDLDCGHRRHTQQMCHMVTLPGQQGKALLASLLGVVAEGHRLLLLVNMLKCTATCC